MKKAGNIFSIVIGICMLGMWGMLLFTGQVKEIGTEPLRIAAHLFSEAIKTYENTTRYQKSADMHLSYSKRNKYPVPTISTLLMLCINTEYTML